MIAVSYLKSIYDKKTTLAKIDKSIADLIHVDLMDGIFVSEKNFTLDEVILDLKNVNKPLDIHLMVQHPEEYIEKLGLLHPKIITFHLNTSNILKTIEIIKDYNVLVGIAINPDEDVSLLNDYIDLIDYVLVMGVYPGLGGQKFIPEVLEKVKFLKSKNVLIGIDGGVNMDTINIIKQYNFDIIVSGSFVCMSDNFDEKITELK